MRKDAELTLDQQRAKYAWECAQKSANENSIKEYTGLVKSVASLIMNSGLMQTLAFLESKKDKQHGLLIEHLMVWIDQRCLNGRIRKEDSFKQVMTALYTSDPEDYRYISNETMALLRWLRQMADAHKSMEKNDGETP